MFFEMDNSWQSKCSSFWPSPSPSQQFQSQSSRNQIDMTVAQYMHPFVAQETCPVERAIRQEPMVFSSPNLGSCKSGKPEMGSSFLALLSGPFHQLHCEFQQLSNSRSSVSASNPNIHDSNIGITGPSPEVSVPIVSSLTQRHGNESTGNGADLSPALASRALATSTCSRVSVSLDNLQTANLPFHGSDSAKQDLHHMVHSNETVMEVSSLRRGWLTNTVPMNAKQQHTINFEASQKVSEEAKFAVSDHTSSSTRVHPRVFCLGTSGDLFLSNSGCLGVVCSCHNLHMSVANFCEHSGSCAINPGDAVRLESGESIAQWCKLHFVKFGLRVPDDNTGWEWADGSSSASGSARHKAAIGQSMSKNSGIFQPVDPFGGRVWPEQHLSGLVSPKNQYGGQAIMENSASKVIQNSQLRNGLEGQDTHVKNFVGISHGTVPTLADNQTLQTLRDTLSRGLKMSDIAPDNGRKNCRYQSSAGYIGSTSKAGNPFISNQSLENLMPFDKGSDASRYNTSQEAFIMDGDTVHSNIELRLGQPSQQSHTFVGSIPSSIRSQAIGRLSDPQKSQFYEQLIQRAVNPRVTEEYKRNLQSVVPDTKQREREIHMNQMGHALRNLNAAENAALNQFRCDATTSSLSSLFPLPGWHFNTPEGHIPNQASDTIIRNCEHLMPRVFGGDSHVVKCVPADCLRNTCDGMERKLEIHGLGLPNHIDVVKSSGAQADTSSYIPEDLFFRSTSCALSTTAGPFSLPVNLSATNPFYISNLTSALPNKKNIDLGQHLLDDNLRLLALRHIVELSKQGHAITPLETNENRGRIHCPLAMQMQKNGFNENLGTSEIRHGLCPTGPHDPSEVAARPVQSCCNHCLGGSFEKLTCLAGSNKSCNFVTSTHGISLQSKEIGVHNSSRHNCGADKQPLLRLGRDTNNHPSGFGEHSHCIHKEPNPCFLGNCTCAVHSKCLAGSCISRMETIADASKEHIASTGGQPLIQLASPGDNNYMIPKAKKNTLDRCESLERYHLMKSGCQPLHWREVPSKVMENCEPACIEKPEVVTNATETIEDQLADTAAKESKGTPQETESLKEQQMSNVCSASCAPTLTEFSVEGITNGASCSVHARKMRFMRNLVDEGSGTEKCCSSDDALDNGRWAETPTLTGKIDSVMAGSSSTLPNQSSSDLIDEPKLSSSVRLKKAKNQIADGCTVREKIYFQIDRESKIEKKKRAIKWKRLNGASPTYNRYPELHFCSFRGAEKLLQVDRGKQKSCCTYTTGTSNLKRKRSALSSANIIPSWKTKLHGFGGHYRDWEDATQGQSSDSDRVLGIPKISAEIKAKQIISKDVKRNFAKHEVNHKEVEKAPKDVSMGSCDKNTRLVVCGNSGIIANGKSSLPKPAKIVSLSLILKTAARCITTENEEVLRTPFMPVTKEACFRRNEACYDSPSTWKKDTDTGHLPVKRGIAQRCSSDRLKPSMHVFKEVRKRSLYELTRKGEDLKERAGFSYLEGKEHSLSTETECHMGVSSQKVVVYASDGKQTSSTKSCLRKISKCLQKTDLRSSVKSSLKNVEGGEGHISEPLQVNGKRSLINGSKRQTFLLDADAFCCVCGSSNKEDFDCLLECSSCLIRVHQACYGVSKVPKGRWGCRPCRAKSENIVCVLCGYKGGAMTRALRSWSIVKSLLQAWKVGRGSKSVSFAVQSDTPKDELSLLNAMPRSGASVHEVPDAVPITRHGSVGSNSTSSNSPGNCFQVHNTITAGVNDPSVKQWVHMVCGLWMPGTRCPNVDTMGAFDVSCVSQARKNVVCSICNRPGGSCIECRVANCSVPFHPWCAHQKGLLQSETEGDDDEKVGFYGRCMRHATYGGCHPDDVHLMDAKLDETSENKESKCERTEGYKGRKRELGFRPNLHTESSDSGGCLVPQEQINAWLHINGQKSGTRGPVKPPAADIEYDCRKEYTRYKQAKGWKHLVLYKSGIHALGLYTSQFISRGAMVVEYVGEIVGLRVADKREMEYHSGRGVQYKSACYFFRIDKEHIIDATRKGGIARFVNHSCLPNCVAKVISVRNEKKVVFFAERDINPGEEITYDYNFNHEDEGKKIPCFCKSKNCRRYLN